MSTEPSGCRSEQPSAAPKHACPPGLTLRAREPSDWQEMAALMQLPRVRWGTLRLPFTSGEAVRKFIESPPEGRTAIVAVLDGRIVGNADLMRDKGRCDHVGRIGMCVHDAHHGRGIGSSLMAALVDTADNWLGLRRLELAVFTDNAPAIRLYKKFGFEIEGTRRAAAFRDGAFVDDYIMARLRGL